MLNEWEINQDLFCTLKANVSQKILNLHSLRHSHSGEICIHFYCLSWLRQARQRKNDSKFSTMTMPKTMPVQNLLRYISFKLCIWFNRKSKDLNAKCLNQLLSKTLNESCSKLIVLSGNEKEISFVCIHLQLFRNVSTLRYLINEQPQLLIPDFLPPPPLAPCYLNIKLSRGRGLFLLMKPRLFPPTHLIDTWESLLLTLKKRELFFRFKPLQHYSIW